MAHSVTTGKPQKRRFQYKRYFPLITIERELTSSSNFLTANRQLFGEERLLPEPVT